ncbi:MAG: hypothetical protein IPG22_07460 [Acidobacteria bacterium]|nr:hypothetical protein [Acidobacteriota bacterium]
MLNITESIAANHISKLEQRLSDATKQNVLLRNAIDAHLNPCGCLKGCEFCNGKYSLDEALAATADLGEYTLCEKEPVAGLHENRPDADVITHAVKNVWNGVVVGRMAQYSITLYAQKGLTKW